MSLKTDAQTMFTQLPSFNPSDVFGGLVKFGDEKIQGTVTFYENLKFYKKCHLHRTSLPCQFCRMEPAVIGDGNSPHG